MALIRWKPWSLSNFFEEDFDMPTIPGLSRLVGQGLNLYETEDTVVAEAAMPGIPEDRIDVTVDDGIVRVSGSYEEKEEEKEKRRYFMTSMARSYNYSFHLPEGVIKDEEPVAEVTDGVLTLKFKRAKKAPPKKIKVTKKSKTIK